MKELFDKCDKCGYEGTVHENEKGQKVCNICFLSKSVKEKEALNYDDKTESYCRICGLPISECDRG